MKVGISGHRRGAVGATSPALRMFWQPVAQDLFPSTKIIHKELRLCPGPFLGMLSRQRVKRVPKERTRNEMNRGQVYKEN